MISDVGGPTMAGSDAKENFFKLYLLERLKKHPQTKFDKILDRSG